MKMNGIHCQVSPSTMTRRADHWLVAQSKSAEAERLPERRERADGHVGQHAEGVGDADRRHHQRHEEDDAEEAAAADLLRAEPGEPGADGELHGEPAADIEQRGAERAELAALADASKPAARPAQPNSA